jgi:hypothetical protein
MLRSTKQLELYQIAASDAVFGRVRDFYFDDASWVIRYLVVDTGEPKAAHRVLLSPHAITAADSSAKVFHVALTQEQVRRSADVDAIKPVSEQHEMGYFGYDEYGKHWGGGGLWGAGLYPDILQAGLATVERQTANDDPHLRSANAVARYYVHASDGDIGHVSGFLLDEQTWAIRYVVVNTSNWWLGHEVIIAPEWIDEVDWAEDILSVDLSRAAVKDSPVYTSDEPLDIEQERLTHSHYGRDGYWPRAPSKGNSAQPSPPMP